MVVFVVVVVVVVVVGVVLWGCWSCMWIWSWRCNRWSCRYYRDAVAHAAIAQLRERLFRPRDRAPGHCQSELVSGAAGVESAKGIAGR